MDLPNLNLEIIPHMISITGVGFRCHLRWTEADELKVFDVFGQDELEAISKAFARANLLAVQMMSQEEKRRELARKKDDKS